VVAVHALALEAMAVVAQPTQVVEVLVLGQTLLQHSLVVMAVAVS
jgi:hypothetical protein